MPDPHKTTLVNLAEEEVKKGENRYASKAYEKAEAKFTRGWNILKDINPIELLHFRCLIGLGKTQIVLKQKDEVKETLRVLRRFRAQLKKISDPDVKQTICNSSYYEKDYRSLRELFESLEKPSKKRKHTQHRTAEKKPSTRHILLQEAPFLSTQLIVAEFNRVYELAKNNPSNNDLAIKHLSKVIRHIISRIDRTDPQTIEQALVVVACRDDVLVKALFEKLLTEIDTAKLNFKQLYHAITQSLKGEIKKSPDDVVQMSQIITEKLNKVHAPDIALSSVIMYSLCQSLAEMRKIKLTKLALNTHKKPIEAAIQSLEQRLQAVNADSDEDKFALARLKHAIALSNHALRHINNHRTKRTRYAHRLKIGAMLFLQIAEVGGSVFQAVESCGVETPAATSAGWNLFSRAIHLTRQAWRHHRADKAYFEAVTTWESAWLAIAESNEKNDEEKTTEQLAQLDALLPEAKKEKTKTYQHPEFCYEITHRLWAVYSVCSSGIREKIIEVLAHYYNASKADPKTQGFMLKRHVAQCLLSLAEQETHLKSTVAALISEEERKVYKEAQATSRPSELYQYNTQFTDMARDAWSHCFADDIDFYEGLTDSRYSEETRFAFIATLQHKIRPTLSYWGRALLATFPQEALEKTAKALGGYDHLANKIVVEKEAVLMVADKAYERKTSIQTGGKAITDPFMQQLIKNQVDKTNTLTDPEKQPRAADKATDPALKKWEKPLAEVIELKGRMNVYYTLMKTHVDFYSKSTDSPEVSENKKKILQHNS